MDQSQLMIFDPFHDESWEFKFDLYFIAFNLMKIVQLSFFNWGNK